MQKKKGARTWLLIVYGFLMAAILLGWLMGIVPLFNAASTLTMIAAAFLTLLATLSEVDLVHLYRKELNR